MASSQGKAELRHADWMATLPENLHALPLTNLAIPGECVRVRACVRAREPRRTDRLPTCSAALELLGRAAGARKKPRRARLGGFARFGSCFVDLSARAGERRAHV
ncbi:hypothetical protein SRHO_G00329490 [Serrasalmus rhombeus]